MLEVPRGQASWEECLAHKVRMAEFELRLDIDNQTRWCLRYFFSLFFFLPPLADVDGRNRPLMVEIDCYNPTLARTSTYCLVWAVPLDIVILDVKLTEVRGFANSKNSLLMQGLLCGRWTVCGHPKAIETWCHGALELSLRHGKDMSVRGRRCDHVILWVPRSDGADSTCIVPKLKGVEAYAPYLDETFDGGTKGTELALVKLGSEGFSTGQEDAETDTLEEYRVSEG
ncbi:hypothetical protein B296_00056330 [Ensete ventricosum]|uniref:Uncharacterized protein n=1 Tax=Ensete ventricosum TaxID=4639 RepID=A0A426X444_ENSVE|nr:hypothetical protein B296_00056330 [Ensete ventricosum]